MNTKSNEYETAKTDELGSEESSELHASSLWNRMRQATGTVYGDIGTSVLYTVMEITRETVLIKNQLSI